MKRETHKSVSLTKSEILAVLSKRLGCSEENLGFLFERPSQNCPAEMNPEMDIRIPDARDALRAV